MNTLTDQDRAAHFESVLANYDPTVWHEENLADLMADAIKWCHQSGLDFDAVLNFARLKVGLETESCAGNQPGHVQSETNTQPSSRASSLPLNERLIDLADDIRDFTYELAGRLNSAVYNDLHQWDSRLLAYANVLEDSARNKFLTTELAEAARHFAAIRQQINGKLTG